MNAQINFHLPINPISLNKNELIVDNFAGGGGASLGVGSAFGRDPDIAINHDPKAIEMHKLNHPETEHYCEDVWAVDPVKAVKGKAVGFAWWSPDCTHFSKARGKTPVKKEIRGLAWVLLRWACLTDMRCFALENVGEFQDWCPVIEIDGELYPDTKKKGATYQAFCLALTTGLPENNEAWEEIKNCLGDDFDYSKIKNGLGYEIKSSVLKADDFGAGTTRPRFYMIGRKDGEAFDMPSPTHGDGLLKKDCAGNHIDWAIPTKSIFGRPKPLAENTLNRIAKGIERFALDGSPFIARIGQTGFGGDRLSWSIDSPLTTVTSKAEHLLITTNIIKLRNGCIGQSIEKPLDTISAGGNHFGEVRAFLIKYYGQSVGQPLNEAIHTITSNDRFGLVTVKIKNGVYQVLDIGMRMLQPHELYSAQGFSSSYRFSYDMNGKKISKKEQVKRVGNSVVPIMAEVIVRSLFNYPIQSQLAA
ncbi:DNA cytosine methyltransferase [Marinicellulosiphila megalodicopiae]|uniref:DNA cytosine methyltransferase n=1 Tax=Marinicellulosiphila megalodicopiae TaxID=2724896 RepID=UPI003BAF0228